MESSGITSGAGAPQRQDYAASAQRETKSIYEMMRDAKEKAEARRDQFKLPKNARYGDAPMTAYAKLARARTPGDDLGYPLGPGQQLPHDSEHHRLGLEGADGGGGRFCPPLV